MPDIERLTRKLDLQRATLADLCALYRASGKLEGLVLALQAHEGAHAPLLRARCDTVGPCAKHRGCKQTHTPTPGLPIRSQRRMTLSTCPNLKTWWKLLWTWIAFPTNT